MVWIQKPTPNHFVKCLMLHLWNNMSGEQDIFYIWYTIHSPCIASSLVTGKTFRGICFPDRHMPGITVNPTLDSISVKTECPSIYFAHDIPEAWINYSGFLVKNCYIWHRKGFDVIPSMVIIGTMKIIRPFTKKYGGSILPNYGQCMGYRPWTSIH